MDDTAALVHEFTTLITLIGSGFLKKVTVFTSGNNRMFMNRG